MGYKAALKKLEEWTDDHGWVGQKDPGNWGIEFGDGVQRTGTLYLVKFYMEPSDEQRKANAEKLKGIVYSALRFSKKKHGEQGRPQWVRHWDATKWPGQLWVGSRDNSDPFFIACALYAPYNSQIERIHKLMIKELWRRGGFTWNYKHIWPKPEHEPKIPDIFWPWNTLCRQLRRSRKWYAWPILVICDLDTLINSLIRLYKSWRSPADTSDDLNHVNRIAFKQMILPTPTVYLAKWLYRLRMQPGKDKDNRMGDNGLSAVKNALRYYARHPNDTPMYLVLDFLIDEYL